MYFRPQTRVGRYRIDFELVSPFGTRWALEIDGLHHDASDSVDRDQARDSFLEDSGYRIARISNKDVRESPERVKSFLERLY